MNKYIITGHNFLNKLINASNHIAIDYDSYGRVAHIVQHNNDYSFLYHDNNNVAYCLYTNEIGSLLYHFNENDELVTTTTPMIIDNNWQNSLKFRMKKCPV